MYGLPCNCPPTYPHRLGADACLATLSGFTSIPIGDIIGGGAKDDSNATAAITGSGSRTETDAGAQPAAPATATGNATSSGTGLQQPAHCLDPDTYLFYDPVHPTTRYHRFVATQGVLPRMRGLGLLSGA